MKQMKIFVVALFTVFMGSTFTSCLDSGNSVSTVQDCVTVDSWMGVITLKSDFYGYTYTPTNPDVLKTSTSDYATRANIIYQLADGEEFTEEKTSYKITITGAANLFGKKFCDPDTLTNNPGTPLYQLGTTIWGANNYLTLAFYHYYTSSKINPLLFDLYSEKAEGTTLYVRLNHNEKIESQYYNNELLLSFRLPGKSELYSKFPELEYIKSKSGAVTDSIYLVVTADGPNTTELKTSPVKVKIN